MKLLVGLGNPGLRYKFTRHNLGYLIVSNFAKTHKIKMRKNRSLLNILGEGRIAAETVVVCLPLTYMNASGKALKKILIEKDIELNQILVICDDIHLPLGKIRIRAKGSDGGHKGLRSIIQTLQTNNFARLRVGVGASFKKVLQADFLLSPFLPKERPFIKEAILKATEACEVWIREGIEYSMNKFN